jgi:hypothetical protein
MGRSHPFHLACLLVASLALMGCETGDQPADRPGSYSEMLAQTEPVPILDSEHGNAEALAEPGWHLVKNEAGLEELGFEPEIEVDLQQQDLIVQALGEQNTGGYWNRIQSVQRRGDTLFVQSLVNHPGDDEMTTQQITYPYSAVLVPETGATRLRTNWRELTGQQPPRAGQQAPSGESGAEDQDMDEGDQNGDGMGGGGMGM